jgi:hypothetical protein
MLVSRTVAQKVNSKICLNCDRFPCPNGALSGVVLQIHIFIPRDKLPTEGEHNWRSVVSDRNPVLGACVVAPVLRMQISSN